MKEKGRRKAESEIHPLKKSVMFIAWVPIATPAPPGAKYVRGHMPLLAELVSYSNGELYGIRMALGASLGDMRMSILMRTPNLAVIGMAWD
jgi:hypothetical protein